MKEYLLVGNTLTDKIGSFIIDEENNVTILSKDNVSFQIRPDYLSVDNTQDSDSIVYFSNAKIMNTKTRESICTITEQKISHECTLGSNIPRYYTPFFDYTTSNKNTILISGEETLSKDISESENVINNIIKEYDENGNLIWEWDCLSHFNDFNFSDGEIYDIKFNYVKEPLFGDGIDWIHLNSVCCIGDNIWYDNGNKIFNPNNLICTSRNLSMVFIIDKNTGDIIWRTKSELGLKFPHYGHIIPKGIEGNGNILILDNYAKSENPRFLEINPITQDIVYEFSSDDISSPSQGSVQKLPDGDYLLTVSARHKIYKISPFDGIVDTITVDFCPYRVNAYPVEWIKYLNNIENN